VSDAPHTPAARSTSSVPPGFVLAEEHGPLAESGLPAESCLPAESDLAVELACEERSERWLLVRQVAIVLVLVALLVTHALLG
jgi:hypothetical protein